MDTYDIFNDVLDNALLHLYMSVAETERFTPKAKRNDILVRYLKPMIKDKRYQQAKKEIKRLVALGRVASCDLESKLIELNELSQRYDLQATKAKQLFDLLTCIETELALPARFLNVADNGIKLPNTIYMLQEHIDNGFTLAGEQIAPVSLFLESDKVIGVVDLINAAGLFLAEIQQYSADVKQGHILLHPKK
ncbi:MULTISPECIES: DUF2913 family protein [Shewanella]|uniref:DUF2913 domain-containing protein n=2 Tax=Shewanella TaxID=22 RepID=A9KZR4_SHEB9|nr:MULTISPECIES: DUF2913 family protein [Shewanella]ABX49166.1 conserved hypothetical protein [Shewanella baltica OS195]MDT3282471.1 DUF2913 family protein [Shewanella sp. SP2S1-2]